MTKAELKAVVIECLKKDLPYDPSRPALQVEHLYGEVAAIAKSRGLKTIGDTHNAWNMNGDRLELHANLREPVAGVVWELIIDRILQPGTSSGDQIKYPYIHITEYGRKALQDEDTPYDPDGYVRRLTEKVPKVDDVIVKYVTESAKSLRADCLLGSTITIGCASEKVLLLLIDTYSGALNTTDKPTFDAAIKKARTVKLQHDISKTGTTGS